MGEGLLFMTYHVRASVTHAQLDRVTITTRRDAVSVNVRMIAESPC